MPDTTGKARFGGLGGSHPRTKREADLGREGRLGENVGFCTSPMICGPVDGLVRAASDARANWARIVVLNFAKFTLHTLAIAGAEMVMGFAITGLYLLRG